MADRKSTQGKTNGHQSMTSARVQSDQNIGDLWGSRIDEAMLQVVKHGALLTYVGGS